MILFNNIALIEGDTHFTKWVMERRRLDHDQHLLKLLQKYLKGTMLDVGANIGTHTHYYLKYGEVLAFEPNPRALECLKHNCPKAKIYPYAVSNEEMLVDICEPNQNYGMAYTVPGVGIPTITIDSLQLDRCDYIKIDVEGDECEVLLGAKQTIEKYNPVLFVEVNNHTLTQKNRTPGGLLEVIMHFSCKYMITPIRGEIGDDQYDVLCLPAQSL